MLKDLFEGLGTRKELKIFFYTLFMTTAAMYFIGDRFLFSERSAVLNQNKSEIENLKLLNQKQEKQLEEYFTVMQQKGQQINQLSKENGRLQPYEQVIPDWRKALDDERAKSSQLQEQLNQLHSSFKELKQVADSCVVDRSDLRANISKLNGIIANNALLIDKSNAIRVIEKNKDSVEGKIAELENDPFYLQLYVRKVEQLKRVSAEYHQEILQLRQCSK